MEQWVVNLIDNIIYILILFSSFVVTYIIFLYYWGADSNAEKSYKRNYDMIKDSDEFPRLHSPSPDNVIITSSQNNASKVRTAIKSSLSKVKRKELDIIPIKEGEFLIKREIEIIRNLVRHIPGCVLLNSDFLNCFRNYLGYKIALNKERCIDEVVEYFKNEFEKEENWYIKILELDSAEHYVNIVIFKNPNIKTARKSILNNIFLPMVRLIYQYHIEPLDISAKPSEIEKKKAMLMELLHGLYISKVFVGFIVKNEINDYKIELQRDVRDENKWGYLLLTDENYIGQLKSVGLTLCKTLDYYWNNENYECIFPLGNSINDIVYMNGVFIYNRKKKEAFKEKMKQIRLKEKQKFRKKEGY